jgi:uncharacterized membrane protein
MYRGLGFGRVGGAFVLMPVLYVISGLFVFGIGGAHYVSDKTKILARLFRIFGIKVAMVALFLLTFTTFSSYYKDIRGIGRYAEVSRQFIDTVIILSIFAVLGIAMNRFFNKKKEINPIFEHGIPLGLIAVSLLFLFFPAESNIYTIVFNFIFIGVIALLLYIGYSREDIKLVNIGMFWVWIFVIARYFDFFWDLLPRSLFFMVGGLVLVLGGIALERKRRQLKSQFGA